MLPMPLPNMNLNTSNSSEASARGQVNVVGVQSEGGLRDVMRLVGQVSNSADNGGTSMDPYRRGGYSNYPTFEGGANLLGFGGGSMLPLLVLGGLALLLILRKRGGGVP